MKKIANWQTIVITSFFVILVIFVYFTNIKNKQPNFSKRSHDKILVSNQDYRKLSKETLRKEINIGVREAVNWLHNDLRADGRFYYTYNPKKDKYSKNKYNLLRHTGTVWSLISASQFLDDPSILEWTKPTLDFIDDSIICNSETPIRCILKSPENDKAKLGGFGLALLAFSTFQSVTDQKDYDQAIKGLKEQIIWCQNQDTHDKGHFWSYCDLNGKQENAGAESAYYPGEAMFGLLRTLRLETDDRVYNTVRSGLDYLYSGADVSNPKSAVVDGVVINHWHTYLFRNTLVENVLKQDIQWSAAMLDKLLEMQIMDKNRTDWGNMDGIWANAKSSRTPTQGEALVNLCRFYRTRNNDLKEKCDRHVPALAAYLLSTQFTGPRLQEFPTPKRAKGGWGRGARRSTIRIDVVQHAMLALMGAALYMDESMANTANDNWLP